eukprot:EG_transcript_13663
MHSTSTSRTLALILFVLFPSLTHTHPADPPPARRPNGSVSSGPFPFCGRWAPSLLSLKAKSGVLQRKCNLNPGPGTQRCSAPPPASHLKCGGPNILHVAC